MMHLNTKVDLGKKLDFEIIFLVNSKRNYSFLVPNHLLRSDGMLVLYSLAAVHQVDYFPHVENFGDIYDY